MALTIPTLPDRQAAALAAAYDEAVGAKRRRMLLGVAMVAVLVLASAWMAEVRP